MNETSMKHLLFIIFAFLVVGTAWHLYGETFEEHVDIGQVRDLPFLVGKDAILVRDQLSGETVYLEQVTLSARGFVVIRASEGGPGRVLGVSELLDAGRLKGFEVVPDEPLPPGPYFAELWRDFDQDETFTLENDIPARNPAGVPIQGTFAIGSME